MADEATDFQPITSQEQLDGILKGRLAREREKVASKYADYDDLKAKAAKFDEAEAAQASDLEMARKEIGELKAAAAKRDEADRVLRALVQQFHAAFDFGIHGLRSSSERQVCPSRNRPIKCCYSNRSCSACGGLPPMSRIVGVNNVLTRNA